MNGIRVRVTSRDGSCVAADVAAEMLAVERDRAPQALGAAARSAPSRSRFLNFAESA